MRPYCNSNGRPLWSRLGPCCCGGGGPCGVLVGPGCGCGGGPGCSVGQVTAELRRFLPGGNEVLVYARGQNCCCANVAGIRATVYLRLQFFDQAARPWTITLGGSGFGPAITVTRTVTGPFPSVSQFPLPLSCGAQVPSVEEEQFFGMVNGGFYLADCESARLEAFGIDGLGPGRPMSLVKWIHLEPNPGPCLPPDCHRGACCCGGECFGGVSPAECAAMSGGVYRGDGVLCANVTCTQPGERPKGACCRPDGSCAFLSAAQCAAADGTYFGDGSACAGVVCPPPQEWACCLPGGICLNMANGPCLAQGGTWNRGQLCANFDCNPQPIQGACCMPGGACVDTDGATCINSGGAWRGGGTFCATTNCNETGACCHSGTHGGIRTCTQETEANCLALNLPVWHGIGTSCGSVNCEIPPRPAPIVVATGAETLRYGGGCAGCGIVEGLAI